MVAVDNRIVLSTAGAAYLLTFSDMHWLAVCILAVWL